MPLSAFIACAVNVFIIVESASERLVLILALSRFMSSYAPSFNMKFLSKVAPAAFTALVTEDLSIEKLRRKWASAILMPPFSALPMMISSGLTFLSDKLICPLMMAHSTRAWRLTATCAYRGCVAMNSMNSGDSIWVSNHRPACPPLLAGLQFGRLSSPVQGWSSILAAPPAQICPQAHLSWALKPFSEASFSHWS